MNQDNNNLRTANKRFYLLFLVVSVAVFSFMFKDKSNFTIFSPSQEVLADSCTVPDGACVTVGCTPASDVDCIATTAGTGTGTGTGVVLSGGGSTGPDISSGDGLGVAVAILSGNSQPANPNVYGYAWSSNIGWINLNCANNNSCSYEDNSGGDVELGYLPHANKAYAATIPTDYGVHMDLVSGNLTGYAWSSNIGWISFFESGCPSDASNPSCQGNINQTTGVVSGWARALNGLNPSDANYTGWDGWISLKGTNAAGVAYGVQENTTTRALTGFAWGSYTVGWVEFDASLAPPSVLTLSALPNPVMAVGDQTTLTWSTAGIDLTNCMVPSNSSPEWLSGDTLVGLNSGNGHSESLLVTVPNNPTTYNIQCLDHDGYTVTASTVVTVCDEGDAECTDTYAGSVLLKVETSPLNTVTAQASDISINPDNQAINVAQGGSLDIYWGADHVGDYSSCTAYASSTSLWNWSSPSYLATINPLALGGPITESPGSNILYTISCESAISGSTLTASVRVTVINCKENPKDPACSPSSGFWADSNMTCDTNKEGDFITNLHFSIIPSTPPYTCTLTTNGGFTASFNAPPFNFLSALVPTSPTNFGLTCTDTSKNETNFKDISVNQCRPSIALTGPGCVKPETPAILSWDTSLMNNCTISNPIWPIPTADLNSGSAPFQVNAPSQTFTLNCSDIHNNPYADSWTVQVTDECTENPPAGIKKSPHYIER